MVHRISFILKHMVHTTTILFVLGFIFDMIMLPDIDHVATRYLGGAHLLIVASLIMFREWIVSRNTASEAERKWYSFATFFIAFSSGAALSFVCVYALRAATLSVSWPLFVLLFICIIANEFVDTHGFRFSLDVGVLLLATLFYIIFNTPVVLKVQNDWIFAVSLFASGIVSYVYIFFLKFSSESARHEVPRLYALAIGIPMFVGMLYFLNVIPAVPLSLKSAGSYHHISHTEGGEFIALKENDTRFLNKYRTTIHHMMDTDDAVYFFSNIETPAELTAPISHIWEKYDESTGRWVVSTVIAFDIEGGREDGYRAYSKKENISDSLWRVTVKIGGNRVIGREKFRILSGEKVELQEVKL